LELPEISSIR